MLTLSSDNIGPPIWSGVDPPLKAIVFGLYLLDLGLRHYCKVWAFCRRIIKRLSIPPQFFVEKANTWNPIRNTMAIM